MEPKDQEIKLIMNVTKTITLKVKPHETIKNLKKVVMEKESLSESEDDLQELRFLGEKLKDECKLVDYGIQVNSTLNLIVNKFDMIKLFISVPSLQKLFELNAYPCYTTKKIRYLINEQEGMNSDSYTLYYNGNQMEDNATLTSLNIQTKPILYLVFQPKELFSVSVKMPGGEVFKPKVKAMHKVWDLKAILGSMLGYPVDHQSLVYLEDELEDWRTLADYNIGMKSELHMLAFKFPIFVKDWNGKLIVANVRGDDKVCEVKNVVFEKLGIPADVYRLMYAGKLLESGSSLGSYNIGKDCTLNILYLSRNRKSK